MITSQKFVKVWDIPVRLFHWVLVALVLTQWLTAEADLPTYNMQAHVYCGYAILSLVLFRIVWGFVGSTYARFYNFIYGPAKILEYATNILNPNAKHYLGHNPMGGLSVFGLLAILLFQAVTGLFANDDIATTGPLAQFVSENSSNLLTKAHKFGFDILLILVALHLSAIFFYLLVKKENLVRPMIFGKKAVAEEFQEEEAKIVNPVWAFIIYAVIAAAVFGGLCSLS